MPEEVRARARILRPMPVLIVDGALCAAFRPPVVRAGHVFAALAGCLAHSVDRVRVDNDGVIAIVRGEKRVLLRSGERRELVDGVPRELAYAPFWYFGAVYVPVRESFAPLGAVITENREFISVQFPPPSGLMQATPAPKWYPAVSPASATAAPSPMPVFTQPPHPEARRTPVHVLYIPKRVSP